MTPTGNTRKDFSPQGLLSSALPGFEPREAQVQMAEAVDQALEDGDILVVEAGTGVGKSLAYLLPALRRAFAPEGEAKSLLLSTATLTLQDQLLSKDIPVALKALGISAEQAADRVVRAMGRANYFCRLRFEMLDTPLGPELFEAPARSNALKIGAWAAREPEPVRDRLPFEVDAGVWEKVNVDAFGCLGAACPHARDCFFLKERERLRRAKVAVVNHAMLLSDVAARRDRSALLPDMDFLVVDEAHHLERMASEHLGIRLGMLELEQALNPVMDPRSGKGLAARLGFPGELALQTAESRSAAHHLFDQAAGHLKVSGATVGPHGFDDAVSGHLLAVAATLKKSAEALNDEALASEVKAAAIRLEKAADGLRAWLGQTLPAQVYWMEPRGRKGDLVLRSAPLRAGEALAAELYPRFASIIFTSATLATHKGLGFSKTRLGLPEATSELVLGSPFDYRTQVQMHLDTRVSDPRKGEEAYLESLERAVKDALIRSQGRAFVLFTSFRHLHALALMMKGWIGDQGWLFLEQGGRLSRERMLEKFRASGKAVLFGAASFWEGVDVPGEALSCVVITRLPFAVPDTPLEKARTDEVQKAGGNAFADLSLPEAVLRLKQGFGRLLRHSDDSGSITILDARVLGSSYGRSFLKALPRCRVFVDGVEQEDYT